MEGEPPVKVIDIDRARLKRGDVGVVREICDEVEKDPEMVRMFQGSIGLRFEADENRSAGPWQDPAVRAWGREAYGQAPHLLYYLHPDPGFGALALVLYSFLEPESIALAMTPPVDLEVRAEVLGSLSEHLTAAAAFARKAADPWEPILERLLGSFDRDVALELTKIVASSVAVSPGA